MKRRLRITHLDGNGRLRMVDTSAKEATLRRARARGAVQLSPEALRQVQSGALLKGDVVAAARLAGIAAAKRTASLIPLCHVLPLDHVGVELSVEPRDSSIRIEAEVTCRAATGAEMEAIVAVLVAAATVYDMCKAVDRGIRISEVELLEKSGGRSGTWRRQEARRSARRGRVSRRHS